MNYAQIRKYDVANGPGIRTTFFLTGCDRNCPNCFNTDYIDFNHGKKWISYLKLNQVEGLTVLGGEPFENPVGLLQALRNIKKEVSKSIWVYSGFVYDDLVNISLAREILEEIDVLVDGEFIEELKDLSLKFRGSSNQRVIDIKKSLENNEVVILNGYK